MIISVKTLPITISAEKRIATEVNDSNKTYYNDKLLYKRHKVDQSMKTGR